MCIIAKVSYLVHFPVVHDNQGWAKYCTVGKFQWKMPAWQILQKSLKWQILAFMNKVVLKTWQIKDLLLHNVYFAKNGT